jgi:hypothetical protein
MGGGSCASSDGRARRVSRYARERPPRPEHRRRPPAVSMAGALLELGARLPGATCQRRDHDLCLPIGAIRTAATPTPSTPHRCHTCAVPDGVGDGPSDHEW